MVVVVVVDKPVWPKGAEGGLSRGQEAEPPPLPIVYVTSAYGPLPQTAGWRVCGSVVLTHGGGDKLPSLPLTVCGVLALKNAL